MVTILFGGDFFEKNIPKVVCPKVVGVGHGLLSFFIALLGFGGCFILRGERTK